MEEPDNESDKPNFSPRLLSGFKFGALSAIVWWTAPYAQQLLGESRLKGRVKLEPIDGFEALIAFSLGFVVFYFFLYDQFDSNKDNE